MNEDDTYRMIRKKNYMCTQIKIYLVNERLAEFKKIENYYYNYTECIKKPHF